VCSAGKLCATVDEQVLCVVQTQLDDCDALPDGTMCTDGGTCHSGVCLPTECGNRRIDAGEVCDDGDILDGNVVNGRKCSARCDSTEVCGNGTRDVINVEACDDGNILDHDGCSSACEVEELNWHHSSSPGLVTRHAAAFDAARDKVVLYVGETGRVHEWDAIWREFENVPSPMPRQSYSLAYAPAFGGTVLFSGTPVDGNAGLGDTYVWNGAGWKALPPGPEIFGHAMGYDAKRARLVVVGGRTATSNTLNDVWEFDGTTWTKVASGPPASLDLAIAYDAKNNEMVAYLGNTNQTWTYDGTTWTNRMPSVGPNVQEPVMAYVPALERVVMFGGVQQNQSITGRMYVWDGSPGVKNWVLRGPYDTVKRKDHALAEDGRGRLFMYGGCTSASTTMCSSTLEDTQFYDGTNWFEERTPPPAVHVATTYANGKIVRFGGGTAAAQPITPADTWELTRRGWQKFSDGPAADDSPPPLYGARMVYDDRRDQLVLFGGIQAGNVVDGRTWLRTGSTWTTVMPTPSPPGRILPSMAFDQARGVTVMFGGLDLNGFVGGTWLWNGSTWSSVTAGPSARVGAAMAYDRENELVVLFGGFYPSGTNDVWVWNGTAWTELTNRVGPQPLAAAYASLTWDPALQRLILTGGDSGPFSTWVWTGNGQQSSWERVFTLDSPPELGGDFVVASIDGTGLTTIGGAVVGILQDDMWELRMDGPRASDGCAFDLDVDGDAKTGCEDPDCWTTCSPTCPPGTSCPAGEPGCGDGACSSVETCQTCPTDCVTCTSICGDFVCEPGESCPGDCP